jgi:hypothetical protein
MITSIFAALLGIFYFFITVFVIKTRRRLKISLGDGNNPEMLQAISAHSNFQSYIPYLVILLFFVEYLSVLPASLIIILGLIIFIGRLLHFQGIVTNNFKLRAPGMILTLFPLMAISLVLIFSRFFQ